MEYRITIMANK